ATPCFCATGRSKKARDVSSMRVTRPSGMPCPAIVKKPMSVQAVSTARATAARSAGEPSPNGLRSITGTVVSIAGRLPLGASGELERVLQDVVGVGAGEPLAALAVARYYRLEERAGLGPARLHALGEVEGAEAEHQDLRVDVLEQAGERPVAGGPEHAVVEVDGRAGVALHLAGRRRPLHLGHRGLEGGARICIEVAGGLAHRERLESSAHHEEVADLVPAVVEDEDAVARHRVHHAFALEAAHRVPDRRAAHAQVAADLLDVQLGAGREDLTQDEVADGPAQRLAEALGED